MLSRLSKQVLKLTPTVSRPLYGRFFNSHSAGGSVSNHPMVIRRQGKLHGPIGITCGPYIPGHRVDQDYYLDRPQPLLKKEYQLLGFIRHCCANAKISIKEYEGILEMLASSNGPKSNAVTLLHSIYNALEIFEFTKLLTQNHVDFLLQNFIQATDILKILKNTSVNKLPEMLQFMMKNDDKLETIAKFIKPKITVEELQEKILVDSAEIKPVKFTKGC